MPTMSLYRSTHLLKKSIAGRKKYKVINDLEFEANHTEGKLQNKGSSKSTKKLKGYGCLGTRKHFERNLLAQEQRPKKAMNMC